MGCVLYRGQRVGLCENNASKTHNAVIVIIIEITLSFSSLVDKSTVIFVVSTATTIIGTIPIHQLHQ